SPGFIMLCATALCVAAAAAAIYLAVSQPWIGLRLAPNDGVVIVSVVSARGPAAASGVAPGVRLVAIEAPGRTRPAPIDLEPTDLVEDPDGLDSYATRSAFME